MTDDERRANRLATYTKYNTSTKGKARYERYDNKHPERKETRWEPARNKLRNGEVADA